MSDTVTKAKLSLLKLVYPPVSNQEASWLQSDPEVEAEFRASDFYMIAGRAEAKFSSLAVDPDTHLISFHISIGANLIDAVQIQPNDLPAIANKNLDSFWVEAGEKLIRIWDGPVKGPGSNVLDWFTTEKLLWDRSRAVPGISLLNKYREMMTYDLLYVGIAKVGDSFDRLIKNGHKARMEILSNENQRLTSSRVTDEIYLFLFHVEPLVVQMFEPDHAFTEEDFSGSIDRKPIVADAEKAFVSLLKPDYNIVKFQSYPRGADSLYGSDYARYGYAIAENILFNTMHGRFRGGWDVIRQNVSNEADSIFVEGEAVQFYKSGVDYPSD